MSLVKFVYLYDFLVVSYPRSVVNVNQKDPVRCLGWEPACPVPSAPRRHPVGQNIKSLQGLLKTELWFTASKWLQCIQRLCSSTVVTMAWHLSTISLGQPPSPKHGNVNGIVTGHSLASGGITHLCWLHHRKFQVKVSVNFNNYQIKTIVADTAVAIPVNHCSQYMC